MKENKYDDAAFFAQYSRMARSVQGLDEAGEWPALFALLPDLKGKRVLDLGCGFGWHCRYAAKQGALSVLGIDLSERMLSGAKERTHSPRIGYQRVAIEDYAYPAAAFDVVISSLSLHYVATLGEVFGRVHRCLCPGGAFVFSAEHPIFTASGLQDWHYGADGAPLHWPVDRYFDIGPRDTRFLGEPVRKYHRTVEAYAGALLEAGFSITGLLEVGPSEQALAKHPEYRDERRRPMFLLMAGQKGTA